MMMAWVDLGLWWRGDEVALRGAGVTSEGRMRSKKSGELEAERRGVGKQADDGGGDDERGKERDHRGVGRGLREVEAVVLDRR